MRVTSNSTGSHLEQIVRMVGKVRLVFVSPFLAQEVEVLLREIPLEQVTAVDLVTTLRPGDPEQVTKPRILRAWFDYFREHYPHVALKIHVDNSLHGKIYIAETDAGRQMLLTSANFTNSGMTRNHEWGLVVDKDELISQVIEEVYAAIEYPEITYHQIERACLFAEQYQRMHPDWLKRPDIYSDILETIYSDDDGSNPDPQYFLKPIGTTEEPVLLEDRADYSDLHQDLHFSKRKPSGVRKGDIVITTAVGPGALLSYFKVTGGLEQVTEERLKQEPWLERWPWFMEGRNQTPRFGKDWWQHNLRRQDLLQEFLSQFPGQPVTGAGGFTLNTLQQGSDKVRITKEFGDFLIQKIRQASPEDGV